MLPVCQWNIYLAYLTVITVIQEYFVIVVVTVYFQNYDVDIEKELAVFNQKKVLGIFGRRKFSTIRWLLLTRQRAIPGVGFL